MSECSHKRRHLCPQAKHRESGDLVALKALQLQSLGEGQGGEGLPLEMMREMSILMSLRHPNIVSVSDAALTPPKTAAGNARFLRNGCLRRKLQSLGLPTLTGSALPSGAGAGSGR